MKADHTESKVSGRVFLSLGSNLGAREEFLRQARCGLEEHPGIRIVRETSILENRAILYEDQPDFLNQILEIETTLSPRELLVALKKIEIAVGRRESFRYGPREIDLDILSFGSIKINSVELEVPHPALSQRAYLSRLLSELGESPDSLISGSRNE